MDWYVNCLEVFVYSIANLALQFSIQQGYCLVLGYIVTWSAVTLQKGPSDNITNIIQFTTPNYKQTNNYYYASSVSIHTYNLFLKKDFWTGNGQILIVAIFICKWAFELVDIKNIQELNIWFNTLLVHWKPAAFQFITAKFCWQSGDGKLELNWRLETGLLSLGNQENREQPSQVTPNQH